MSKSSFCKDTVVEIDGRRCALLRKVSDVLWQLEDERTKRIFEYSDGQLREFYVAGKLCFANAVSPLISNRGTNFHNATDEALDVAKLRRLYVKSVFGLPNTREAYSKAIQKTWEILRVPPEPPNWTTVYRWRRRYDEAGADFHSLIDNTKAKGNRSDRYPSEVSEAVKKAIALKYMRLERGTLQETLDCACAVIVYENKLRPKAAQLPLPSRRHVSLLIGNIPAFDRVAARYGKTVAAKRFRGVHGHRTTAEPLERAEIDHTLLDLLVIDDNTRLPMGRPWITACIDDYTRCLLGLYISFEPPSHFTVSRCLKQAFMPKVSIKTDYPSIVNSWDAHGVMRELVVDNGTEFHSASLENACYSLGIEIHYSARKTPWFKGKIERFLGTLNRAVAHGNPGTTFHNIFEKEEYDPSKHAVVRYSVLKEVIHMWIVDVYHQQTHRALGVSPASMWIKNIIQEDIQVPSDPLRLDAILGRSEVRRLTHKGIELDGLLYNSSELTGLRRILGEKLDVEIRVDNSDLGKIVVFSPDKRQMFTVPALASSYARGLTEWQHRVCKRFAAQELREYSTVSWTEAKARIAALIDNEFMHKKQKTRSKIARFKGEVGPFPSDVSCPLIVTETYKSVISPETVLIVSSEPRVLPPAIAPASRKKFNPVYRERAAQAEKGD